LQSFSFIAIEYVEYVQCITTIWKPYIFRKLTQDSMNTKTISALVILVGATVAVMSMGSLSVHAQFKDTKYCFDLDHGGGPQTFCWVSKKVCELNRAATFGVLTECYKNPLK
jgi:hypothetical protein